MTPQELRFCILSQALSGRLTYNSNENPEKRDNESEEKTPFCVPLSWEWSTLGDCCEIYTGNSISESVKKTKYAGRPDGYDYIATKDVSNDHVISYDNGVRIPEKEHFRIAPKGSVLICIEGGSAGRKIGILDRDVCFGNKLCMLKPNKLYNWFLYYYLQSREFKDIFYSLMTGIIGGVSIKKLKGIPVPVPAIGEQEAIVERINDFFEQIDSYEVSQNKLTLLLEELKKALLEKAVQGGLVEQDTNEGSGRELYETIKARKKTMVKEGRIKKEKNLPSVLGNEVPFSLPENWIWVRIGDIAYKVTDGTHKTPTYTNTGVKFVSAKNLYNGVLSFDDCKYISESEHKELYLRCNPEAGDILISKSGSIGTVVAVDVDYEFSMFESLALIKYDQELLNQDYCKYALQNACYHLSEDSIRGVAVKHLPIADIKSLLFPLPPLKEQKRIANRLDELFAYCESVFVTSINKRDLQ